MENNLIKGNVFKALMAFAIPFILSNILQMLYSSADLMIVGQFSNTSNISGVSIGSQTMHMVTQLALGFTTGITILLGQYFGAGKKRDLSKIIGSSILFFGIVGIVLTIGSLIFNHQIVELMNTPIQAIESTRSYIFICSTGILFIIGYNVISAILRGLGDSKTPLYFVMVACVVNIGLDLLLVAGFNMGASGAAIATISAQGLAMIIALIYLKHKGIGFKFYLEDIKCVSYIRKVVKIGFPIAVQGTLITMSFLIITVVINSMGVVASASVGVVENLINFLMLPSMAIGNSIATMVAQNIGAKQPERAFQSMRFGMMICIAFAMVMVTICQINPEMLTAIFTSDKDVIYNAGLYLKSYSIDCLGTAVIFCLNGYYNGCGKTFFTMFHNVASTFIVRIPVTFLISTMSGITLWHMGLASPLASLASIIMCLIYAYIMKKKKNGFISEL